jgi:DNA (cytosine-5)-methyltransferase 1
VRIGSLFSGVGGFELGLEWAGVGETVFQVESDPYALAVLEQHWPDVPRFTDVRSAGAHNLPPVDVLCGGFPCQDISLIGDGAGLAGERSGLWSEFERIIEELEPEYVAIENVAVLRRRGMGGVLRALMALGYDAEWHCIPASHVGAPHPRDRLFIVAYRRGPRLQGHARHVARAGEGTVATGPVAAARLLRGRASRTTSREQWATEPDVGRVAYGAPALVDRLRCIGNAVVPHVAEYVGRNILLRIAADRAIPLAA